MTDLFKDMYTTKMSSGKSLKERFEKIKLGKSSKMTAIFSLAVLMAGIIGVVIFASFVDGKDEKIVMYPADGDEFEMQYPGGAMAREDGWIDFDFLLDNEGGIHIAEHFICDDISNVKSGNNHTEKIEFKKLEGYGRDIYKLTERYTSPAAASEEDAFSIDIDMYFIPYPDAENEYLVLSMEKGAFEENVAKSMAESVSFKDNDERETGNMSFGKNITITVAEGELVDSVYLNQVLNGEISKDVPFGMWNNEALSKLAEYLERNNYVVAPGQYDINQAWGFEDGYIIVGDEKREILRFESKSQFQGAAAAVGAEVPDASYSYDGGEGDADMIDSGIYEFMASNFKKMSYVVKEAKVDSEKGTARIYIEIQHSDDESNDYLTILLEKRKGEWSIQDYWLEK